MKSNMKIIALAGTTIGLIGTAMLSCPSFAQPGPTATEQPDMTSHHAPQHLITKWVDAYNAHDLDAVAELYHEHVTNTQLPWGKTVKGREAMRETFSKVFRSFPDIRITVENVVSDGDWVILEWRFTGTMRGEFAGYPPNAKSFDMRGCEVFQIADGRIMIQRGYWDKATMFSQLELHEPDRKPHVQPGE